jgi:hypothetical protein
VNISFPIGAVIAVRDGQQVSWAGLTRVSAGNL